MIDQPKYSEIQLEGNKIFFFLVWPNYNCNNIMLQLQIKLIAKYFSLEFLKLYYFWGSWESTIFTYTKYINT